VIKEIAIDLVVKPKESHKDEQKPKEQQKPVSSSQVDQEKNKKVQLVEVKTAPKEMKKNQTVEAKPHNKHGHKATHEVAKDKKWN